MLISSTRLLAPSAEMQSPGNYKQAFLVSGLGYAMCAVLILAVAASGHDGRMAFDETNYHLPTIVQFANGGSLSDYPSATAPGYHLLMAVVSHGVGASTTVLRLFGALLTAALLFVLSAIWVQATRPAGAWLALPAMTSLYVLPAGVWLLPDNLGWLTVAGVLWLSLLRQWDWRHVVGLSVLAALSVLVRQSNAWVVAPILVAITFGAGRQWPVGLRIAAAAVTVLPAMALVAIFVWLWGGLAPPSFQGVQGFSPLAPAWVLTLFSVNALFYGGLIARHFFDAVSSRGAWVTALAGGGVGLLLSISTASTYDKGAGRWSGLWHVVEVMPAPFGHSLFVMAGAMVGGALLAFWLYLADPARRLTLLAAICGFCAAQAANHSLLDRYYVGFVMILFSLLALSTEKPVRLDVWTWAGVAILAGINAAVLVSKLL